ncbi:MAG: fatty acid desaturase [Cyanobium sp.]
MAWVVAAAGGDLIEASRLAQLNRRSDAAGWRQLLAHGALIAGSAAVWWQASLPWPLRLVALGLLGLGLAFSFCAMHECAHRTAFASRSVSDAVAWWAGVLSFYNADFYRRYHQWHHRFTHQPGLDPELEDPAPSSLAAYLLELSGGGWWLGKLRGHWRGLAGDFRGCPYIPAEAAAQVRDSIRRQFAVYGVLLLASIPAANGLLLWGWLLPLALGQPLLRFVLLAEHGGCATSPDGLENTRTTLTLAPLRWLMWNMPFHTEHHLYPSLPFHALAAAHRELAPQVRHLDPGYLAVHRGFLRDLSALAIPEPA